MTLKDIEITATVYGVVWIGEGDIVIIPMGMMRVVIGG